MSTRNSALPRSTHEGDKGPLLGALLRLCHQALLGELFRALADAGFDDVQPAHVAPLRTLWDYPDGVRATELARISRITKQSMGVLIDQLETRGYVERLDDPTDGRAKVVRLTTRGRELGTLMRKIVRRVESDWARRIGAERVATLRSTLSDLLSSLDAG